MLNYDNRLINSVNKPNNEIFIGSDSALVSAIKSVAAVEGRNLEQFSNCLQASHVGDAAKFALVQALNSQETISNRQVIHFLKLSIPLDALFLLQIIVSPQCTFLGSQPRSQFLAESKIMKLQISA